jgi:hypothetical protein
MRTQSRLLLFALALCVCAQLLLAQDAKHEAQLRTVRGVVADKATDSPVPSAVVFLRNTRTNAVRSYIANDEGDYRFSGLDPNIDYEIHAEKDGAKSSMRTVSSFDNKKEIVITLKLEKKKS